jgi:8-oxo-dGTP pyrophosphatase MutT (NUDIX family)
MNRAGYETLVAALGEYGARNPGCRATAEVSRFVTTEERWWQRENVRGHVTASAWIVDRAARAALLVHHRKLQRWLQPGGHLENDDSIHAAALREAREETGVVDLQWHTTTIFDIDIHTIPERKDFPAHSHLDVRFLFEGDRNTPLQCSEESLALRWCSFAELPTLGTDESVLRLARKTPR